MAIMVFVNRDFFVLFSGGQWQGYAASNGSDGFNYFTIDGNWIGYFSSNSQTGLNLFNTDGDWIGFTT